MKDVVAVGVWPLGAKASLPLASLIILLPHICTFEEHSFARLQHCPLSCPLAFPSCPEGFCQRRSYTIVSMVHESIQSRLSKMIVWPGQYLRRPSVRHVVEACHFLSSESEYRNHKSHMSSKQAFSLALPTSRSRYPRRMSR